jgi:2-aminoethylphosphonate-pyruvate transaminase
VTFHAPNDPAYDFTEFYRRVRDRGFILYPGKLTAVETFRVGCIGAIGADTLKQAVAAIGETLREMGVRKFGPA